MVSDDVGISYFHFDTFIITNVTEANGKPLHDSMNEESNKTYPVIHWAHSLISIATYFVCCKRRLVYLEGFLSKVKGLIRESLLLIDADARQ